MRRNPSRFVLAVLVVLAALVSAVPPAAGAAVPCKFLTPDEAASVIGAGARLRGAIENGACSYERGKLTLTVAQPFSYDDPKIVVQGFEGLMAGNGGQPESDIGDRAFLAKMNSGYQLGVLKGATFTALEVYGEGSDGAEVADRLRAAARKVAARL